MTSGDKTRADLVVRNAQVGGASDGLVDVAIADGSIVSVEPAGSGRSITADGSVDAAGCWLLPGLHDHHIHLAALAASLDSVALGGVDIARLGAVLRGDPDDDPDHRTWVRAVDYHESSLGELDRTLLDAVVADRPVRVQHRSGAMWVLNSSALAAVRADDDAPAGLERDAAGRPTGRLYGGDAWLRDRTPARSLDFDTVGRMLAGFGVTGVADLTPSTSASDITLLADAVRAGSLPVHVMVTGGVALAGHAFDTDVRVGPVKLVVGDDALPDLDVLVDEIRRGHAAGRNVAIHCVSRVALILVIAAWDDAGVVSGDRIEHGAVIPVETIAEIRQRGLLVVTQPSFVARRGDEYLTDVEQVDVPHLWRCGSLLRAGVDVAGSTDAPYGDPDPWRSMVAATQRLTPAGISLGGSEQVSPQRAVELFLGALQSPSTPRRIAPGEPADLCLLGMDRDRALGTMNSADVRLTIVAGTTVFERSPGRGS